MTYTLYYYPGNANVAVHILLEELGCDYELALVDRSLYAQKSDEYLRLNPNGTIPTLVSGSLVLFETAAICMHIADQHPSAGLAAAGVDGAGAALQVDVLPQQHGSTGVYGVSIPGKARLPSE